MIAHMIIFHNIGKKLPSVEWFFQELIGLSQGDAEALANPVIPEAARSMYQSVKSYNKTVSTTHMEELSLKEFVSLLPNLVEFNLIATCNQLKDASQNIQLSAFTENLLETLDDLHCAGPDRVDLNSVVETIESFRGQFKELHLKQPFGMLILNSMPVFENFKSLVNMALDTLIGSIKANDSMAVQNCGRSCVLLVGAYKKCLTVFSRITRDFSKALYDALDNNDPELVEAHKLCAELLDVMQGLEFQALHMGVIASATYMGKTFADIKKESIAESLSQARHFKSLINNIKQLIATKGSVSLELMELRIIHKEIMDARE